MPGRSLPHRASSTEPVFTCLVARNDGSVVFASESASRELFAHGVKFALNGIADRVKRAGDADLLAACSGVIADLIGHGKLASGVFGRCLARGPDRVEELHPDIFQLGLVAGGVVAPHLPELVDRFLGRDQAGLVGELGLVAGDVSRSRDLVDIGLAVGLGSGTLVQGSEAGAHELVGAIDLGVVRDGVPEQGSAALVKELKIINFLFHALMPPCDK